MHKIVTAALLASALAACAATTDVPVTPPPPPPPAASVIPAGASTADELQGATILDVDKYRPQAALAGCESPLPVADSAVSDDFAAALVAARAYSESADGVGLMILHDGAIVHESYAQGADADSRTASASMMKSVLSLLVGIAIDDGVLGSVDDPMGKYIAEWGDDPRGAITLKQMLQMASGLGGADFNALLLGPDIDAVALTMQPDGPPGEKFNYNNGVSQVIGVALDRQLRKTGKGDFITYLHDKLWCPVGNGSATIWVSPANGNPRYYAGMQATLADWARLGELIRNQGRVGDRQVVPAAWIAEMATPSAANPKYGYQLWLGDAWTPTRKYSDTSPIRITHSAPYATQGVLYFDGFGGQRVYVVPEYDVTIARTGMVNLSYDDAAIVNLLVAGLD